MNVTNDEIKLAHEERKREDRLEVWANRRRTLREGFFCWGGKDCPHCQGDQKW